MSPKKPRYSGETMTVPSPFAALAEKLQTSKTDTPACHSPSDDAVSTATDDLPQPPKLPKVKSARIERAHRGGKTVTIVSFHNAPDENALSAWLHTAKKSLGIGGSIEGENVVLQGDQTKRIDRCH